MIPSLTGSLTGKKLESILWGCRQRWSVHVLVKCYVGIDVPLPNRHKAYDVSL